LQRATLTISTSACRSASTCRSRAQERSAAAMQPPPLGINNLGSTCYVSVVVQSLKYCFPDLWTKVSTPTTNNTAATTHDRPADEELIEELVNLIRSLSTLPTYDHHSNNATASPINNVASTSDRRSQVSVNPNRFFSAMQR